MELDSLQFSVNSPTDVPISWHLSYNSSYVRTVCRAARLCKQLGDPRRTLFRTLLEEAHDTKPEGYERRAKKKLQKTIYAGILEGNLHTPLHGRIRSKIRWRTVDTDTPGQVARRLAHQLPRLGKLVAPPGYHSCVPHSLQRVVHGSAIPIPGMLHVRTPV